MPTRLGFPIVAAIVLATAGPSAGQSPMVLSMSVYIYEDGGFPPSEAGDVLYGCGEITSASSALLLPFEDHEYTFFIAEAVSQGQVVGPGGVVAVTYTGGTIDIYADALDAPDHTPHEYGSRPPNATVPATFTDGFAYMRGEITALHVNYVPLVDAGMFQLQCTLTLDPSLGALVNQTGVLMGGLNGLFGLTLPEGYDLYANASLSFDAAVPAERTAWSEVKQLFR